MLDIRTVGFFFFFTPVKVLAVNKLVKIIWNHTLDQ